MKPKVSLVLTPPFWPNLPPLSLIHLGGFLAFNKYYPQLIDINNIYYRQSCQGDKRQWLKSCNREFEKKIFKFFKDDIDVFGERYLKGLLHSDVVGFSCYKSNLETAVLLAKKIRSLNKNIKIIFGGPQIAWLYFKHNNNIPQRLRQIADLIVIGEGEKAILDFLNMRHKDKIISFEEIDDLNNYDFDYAYRQLDRNNYPRTSSVSLISTRGCIRKCNFCSERLLYKKFRKRTVDDVIEEIVIHKEKGAANFIFHDSMLNADLAFLEELCDKIIERFGSIPWEAQMGIRPDMSERLCRKIKQSGCYNIFIGLESGSSNILKKMRKGFNPEQAVDFFTKLKQAGLSFGVSLIVGYPGEKEHDFKESLRFLIDNKDIIPKIEQVNPFVYYEGTDVDKNSDFYHNRQLPNRVEYFIERLKEHRFKMTKAFLNNLVENKK